MNPATAHSPQPHPRQNQLLAALTDADWESWRPQLELVDLRVGEMLCHSGGMPSHVIFPTTAVVSLLHLTRDGESAEFAVVGNDGMVGICVFMGGDTMHCNAQVQSAGQAYRLSAQVLKNTVLRASSVLNLLLRYTQALIVQMAQTAACNRHHSIDQQFSRRLLMALDRSTSHEVAMTQEGLANLLGVRREGVTAAALKLQQAGVIRYSRGHICVLDRDRLEQRTCECYAAARKEADRLLPARDFLLSHPAAICGLQLSGQQVVDDERFRALPHGALQASSADSAH